MARTFVRVDDRLIHGQTIVAWAPLLKPEQIIGVDDVSAANPVLKSIMTMGVPKQYETHIVTTDEALKLLSAETDKTRLVIVKTPDKLTELKDVIRECAHIYLGNMAKRPDTNHQMTDATGIFYLSDEDIARLDELAEEGFEISFQQVPNSPARSWEVYRRSL